MRSNLTSLEWPPLPFGEWESTCDTLHMWTQIVGKTRAALTPLVNHWWNVTLYVTPRGLTTSIIPFELRSVESGGMPKDTAAPDRSPDTGREAFEVEFDFLHHRLLISTSTDAERSIELRPRSVADFYGEYMACLQSLGIKVKIHTTPDEFDDKTPFDQDQKHASYDKKYVENFWRILLNADRLFKEFRSPFIGKCSPVHFFWGSMDLAVTRFSGRRGSLPKGADAMTREAYSHEVSSCGFWPGDRRYKQPAFYSYTMPAPAGIEKEPVRPSAGHWDANMGEFLLNYDDVRAAPSPEEAILDFCQSTYEAGANLAKWDRQALERGG
jgi:hypothetical protein